MKDIQKSMKLIESFQAGAKRTNKRVDESATSSQHDSDWVSGAFQKVGSLANREKMLATGNLKQATGYKKSSVATADSIQDPNIVHFYDRRTTSIQEMSKARLTAATNLREDANLVGQVASALVKYCEHAETTPMDVSPADQLRCLPAALNQKLAAMDKHQRSDILKQAEKQAYTQMLGDDGEYDTDVKEATAGSVNEVSLGNYPAKAAKSKAMAQMDKAFGYGGDGNSNADSTIKKRTAGLERAQGRVRKSKDAASAKAKEDMKASDIANKEKYEKELAELKGQFDPQYDRSDDHSYWTKHKEMAAKIKDLEKRLEGISEGFVDAMRSKNYSRLANRSLDTAANIIDQENAETDVGPEFMQHMDKYEKRKSRASAINAKQHANAVTESADAASAITLSPDALISILKLAGMQPYAPGAQSAAPQTGMLSSIPTIAVGPAPQPSLAALSAMIPDDLCIDSEEGIEEGGEPQYSNSPDEEYCDTDAILASGNDMHRSKGTYPKVAGGDNPMAMSETEKSQELDDLDLDDELEMLDLSESELMKQFKALSKK